MVRRAERHTPLDAAAMQKLLEQGVASRRRTDDGVSGGCITLLGEPCGAERMTSSHHASVGVRVQTLMKTHVKPAERDDDDMTGALQFHSCQALTPETETSTHYFFMQAHNFRLDDVTITESIYQSLCTAFEEDRRMIEAQQRLINASVPAPMQPIAADLALAQYRRVLQELRDAESTSEKTSLIRGLEPRAVRKSETDVSPA